MTASRGARRSDATWRGSAARAVLPWWWPGDTRLAAALGAGVHLRAGRWPGLLRRRHGLITSSAHGPADLRRAQPRRRRDSPSSSPVFPTAQPSRSRRPRTGPLDAPGPRRAAAGGGARRHRRRPVSGACRGGSAGDRERSAPWPDGYCVLWDTVFRNCHEDRLIAVAGPRAARLILRSGSLPRPAVMRIDLRIEGTSGRGLSISLVWPAQRGGWNA